MDGYSGGFAFYFLKRGLVFELQSAQFIEGLNRVVNGVLFHIIL